MKWADFVAYSGIVFTVLLAILAFSGVVHAVEIPQSQLVPPYKSVSHSSVTLDITLDQVYNRITPTKSTRYYIFRIHNDRATALNLSSIQKQYFMHLTEGTPSNYVFYQFEGYRTALEDGQTVYYTNWTQIPFKSAYIPAGETKIFGLGFDIDRPFVSGDYNISFTFNGQEYFIDPDISACGTISSGQYVVTGDIAWSSGSYCLILSANDISIDGQGHTITKTFELGGTSAFVYSGSAITKLTFGNQASSLANSAADSPPFKFLI